MRNLKKILALVLALVMVIGMMSIASAATPGTGYADDAEITKFDESIQILTALGIYKGDGEGEFEPNDPITRAEVAALVYRIVHDEKYVGIYADYDKFDDVASNAWYAGYVNYCANGEFIVGDGNGSFNPDDYVSGYQVLAIVLRLVGYDREGEFQGAGWEVRTARKAKELGITATITEGTLGANATRGMVAELIYRAIAQTSTVEWSLLTSYTANNVTLAYEYFGLQGDKEGTIAKEANKDGVEVYDIDDYKLMTENEPAGADYAADTALLELLDDSTLYGEPVSFWYVGNSVIGIRYNPIASYTTAVTDGTVYAAAAPYLDPYGITKKIPVFNYAVDGKVEDKALSLVEKNGVVTVAGNGVETDVFFADNQLYVVAKNTYIDQVEKSTTTEFKLLSPAYQTLSDPTFTSSIAKYNMVLFNVCNGAVDVETLEVAKSVPVTVNSTYDSNNINTAYFKSGNGKYSYNANYHEWTVDYYSIFGYSFGYEGVSAVMNGKVEDGVPAVDGTTANYGLGDKANAFFDKYGNVILLGDAGAYTSSGVGVVVAADVVRGVNKGTYVMDLDLFLTDGTKKSVKAVMSDGGFADLGKFEDWSYKSQDVQDAIDALMVNDATLVYWTIDAATGYYVINTDVVGSEIVMYGIATLPTSDLIVRGDANKIGTINVDSTTTYIVEEYKNDGKEIKGYRIYKGFKAVPSLEDLNGMEVTYTQDPVTKAYVIFVKGATKGDQPATVTVPELVYVMDNVPEKNLHKDEDGNTVVYWTYTVVKNGQVTTLKSTTNPEGLLFAGLYEIEKDTEYANFYQLTDVNDATDDADDQQGDLVKTTVVEYTVLWAEKDRIEGVTYGDVLYTTSGKETLADNVKVYSVVGTTLTEITLDKLADGAKVEFIVDKYGYVTTIFVVTGYENDLDGVDHTQVED